MSAGDFLIQRNNADVSGLKTAGINLDALWDTQEVLEASAATYNAGTFTLTNTAPYLIMYSERFFTSDVTNNSRIEGQGRIRMNGVDLIEGAGEGYIRKASGQQTMVINGVAIYNATAGDTFTTRFYRGDDSTLGTVVRVAGFGGVQIIELSAADNFAQYVTTANNLMSNAESNVSNWSDVQQEAGFTRATDSVTIATAGRYFMTLSATTSQTGSARLGATVFLERGTTEVTGVRGYSHMRGAEGNQNGAISFAGIIDVGGGDSFTLRSDCDSGGMTLEAGAVWQFWQLPAGAEIVMMEATNGNMNADAEFAWDTLPHIDTAAFTATAGSTSISVDQGTHALMIWNQGKKVIDSAQRAYPVGTPAINGTAINYAGSGVYHRASGSIGVFAAHGGVSLLPTLTGGTSISLRNSVLGAAGNLDVESGHFSVLKLEGLYKNYTYTFPLGVSDVDGDEIVANIQANVIVTGSTFGAAQGTGKVELVENANYTGTIINQSIDSWSDTSVQFDVNAGALADTNAYLFVTSDTGAFASIAVQFGLPPETYTEAVLGMITGPSHYWRFQNSYADEVGTATANGGGSGGTPTFSTTVIVKGDTHSFLTNAENDYISPADQTDMNTSNIARRYIGGWFMVDRLSQTLSVIYEEGAQVNNMALLNGFGNNAVFQIANASDDYVQLYLDVSLTPNRPYHFLARFVASGFEGGVCKAYLDGVLQSRSDGNPWETAQLDSHSGNISWGHEGTETLKVGDDRGVDATTIAFVSPVNCNYAHWHNWTDNNLDEATDIRQTLFEKGALAQVTIPEDTAANMQTAIDAEANTLFPDWPCSIEIAKCTEGNFTLSLDNITFEDRVSIQVRYLGADVLTLVADNGTVLDDMKISAPYGGTVNTLRPASLTLTGLQNPTEVRVYEAGTINEVAGQEDVITGTFVGTVQVPSVDIVVMSLNYEVIRLKGVDTSANTSLPIQQQFDRNYGNP